MKKLIFLFLIGLLSLTSLQLSAQRNAYELGDKSISAGLSVGYFGFAGSRSVSLPPIIFTGEYGFHELISAGAYFGVGSWRYNYTIYGYDYRDRWTEVSAGVRGSLHLVSLMNEHLELGIDPTKFDFYFTLLAGLEFEKYTQDYDLVGTTVSTGAGIDFGSFFGFEYMVTEQIGLFVETGWNAFGYLTFGATARF